jgi:hypothetical protein
MKTIIACALTLLSTSAYAQSLSARATGVDTGGTSGRILSIESSSSLRSVQVRALQTRRGISSGTNSFTSIKLPTVSINLNNISELTLEDGTVLNKEEIRDLLKTSLRK